ncbi:hypothetical protein HOA55_02805 [archaeon]|nr:hypothetical protein [archaeon]MBT6820259.1 hypothetical protein [archaeon]MBT7025463.1 hypothetical protein [archaeon]MBT7239313.1 hypothetical protein [archaeon]MBT7915421.1 hypothetical protein [Candidatus Bathyarchaeota archaeon]
MNKYVKLGLINFAGVYILTLIALLIFGSLYLGTAIGSAFLTAIIGGLLTYKKYLKDQEAVVKKSPEPETPKVKIQSPSGTGPPAVAAPEDLPPDNSAKRIDQLAAISLQVMNDPLRDEAIISLVDDIVDQLTWIVEEVDPTNLGSQVNITLGRVIEDYLPKQIRLFVKLAAEERIRAKEATVSALTALQERIVSIADKARDGDFASATTEAKFLEQVVQA